MILLEQLTILYSYQRITREDMIDYLYALRNKVIDNNYKINVVGFLTNPSKRVVNINEKLSNHFSKYELMDCLEQIIEKQSYYPQSFLGINGKDGIKKVMQDYSEEKKRILKLTDSIYERKLNL